MRPSAFLNKGKFFKGNLHTHSTNSDGLLSPDLVCKKYKEKGYDFLCISDHFVGLYDYPITDTTNYRESNFTTILSAEVHSGSMQNGEIWHLLAVGLPKDFKPSNSPNFVPSQDQETASNLAQRCRDSGAFVSIAHPQWSGLTLDDAETIGAAHCAEIYNHGCAVDSDRGDGAYLLDLLLSQGKKLNLIATDDAHFKSSDSFGGWVEVKSEKNEPLSLLKSLKEGNFYSSQGPKFFDLSINREELNIETSPISSAILVGYGSVSLASHGDAMVKTKIKFPPGVERTNKTPWVRIVIIDENGRKAWTNPIWTNEL
jgi:hypothetical protein